MPVSGSSIRSVLVGFAGLLILMGCLTFDAALQTRNLSLKSTALRKESRDRDAVLDQLRNDTYRSATLARDYILEPDDVLAASQRAELQQLRSRVENALKRYGESAPKNEEDAVRSLQQRAESYWTSLDPVLDWNRVARREQSEALLRTTIIPGRDQVVQFTKQVNALDEHVFDAAEERIQLLQTRFQRRVATISTFALVVGAILVVIVVRHIQRLAAEAGARFDEVLAAREDLRRLSERLVAVQEEERRSLSRELHDELGQTMSAILLEIGKLESAPAPEVQRERLASVRHLAEENVSKIRNMSLLLRPAMLDELGLIPALRWHAKETARRTGLKVKMIAEELRDDLVDSNRTCIYRVVQEALNNCVKHSHATEVRVVIHRNGNGLSVSVQDDGVGFDPEHNKGLGLLGMMERVNGLGGKFHIESQPGRGTILSTYFPLESGCCTKEQESVI